MDVGRPGTCLAEATWSAQVALPLGVAVALIPFAIWLGRAERFPGQRALVITHLASIWWVTLTAAEISVSSGSCKILVSALSHGGISLVVISWLCFVIRFTIGSRRTGWWLQTSMMIIAPLFSMIIALSTARHGLFYTDSTRFVETIKGGFVEYSYGPLFFINSFFLYVCIAISLALLFRAAMSSRGSGQLRYTLLFAVAAVPILINVFHLFLGFSLWGYDPTPFSFSVVAIIYVIMLVSDATLDVSALARQQVFEDLSQAIFVVTQNGDVRASNNSARSIFEWRVAVLGGMKHATQEFRALFERCRATNDIHCSAQEVGDRFYDIDLRPIFPAVGAGQPPMAWVLTADDVTSAVYLQKELEKAAHDAEKAASLDPMTGLYNRRPLELQFMEMMSEASEKNTSLQIVLVDIDHFKSVNDRYGHDVGDNALISVAKTLKSVFRENDPLFRFGGEEFLGLILAMPQNALLNRLSRARAELATLFQTDASLPGPITFSAGVSAWPRDGGTLEQLVKAADRRLFQAKRAGRDCVRWTESSG